MNRRLVLLLAAYCAWMLPLHSHAAGPVDGELGVIYWNDSVSGSLLDRDLDVGTTGIYGELWFGNKWGVSSDIYFSSFENTRFSSSKQFDLDVKRRLVSATDNSYFAVGAGYEYFDLENAGSSSGLRLVADGRLGVAGIVYLYGQFAWIPAMTSFDDLDDINAKEFEFGAVLDPLPFVSLRAGYRIFDIDANLGSTKSDGFLIGGGVHW